MQSDSSDDPSAAPAPQARGVHDMTQGEIRGHVVRMMLFVLAGMAVQTSYALVDIYWVGRLGERAVAAVALSSNLSFVSLALTQMLSVGCVALVSQAVGRKQHNEVQRLFNQAQSLATCAGILFLAAGFALQGEYARRLSGDAATADLARKFLRFFIPGLALQFAIVALGSALRGLGDMRPALVAQLASVLLNMVLAPFLIFGWIGARPLGVAGAALATLLATLAAVVGLVCYVVRGRTFLQFHFRDWRPDWAIWRRLLSIGLPAGVEFLLIAFTVGVVYFVTRQFGPEAQAGFGIGSRLMQAAFMPAVAVSFSVAAVVGQNLGSRSFDRIHEAARESTKLVLLFMLFFTALCQVAPHALVSAFSRTPDVVAAGTDYLQTISWTFVASGVVFVYGGVFQGLGNTWPSLAVSALRAAGFATVVLLLSARAGFRMHTTWLVSVGSIVCQFVLQRIAVTRELRLKAPVQERLPSAVTGA